MRHRGVGALSAFELCSRATLLGRRSQSAASAGRALDGMVPGQGPTHPPWQETASFQRSSPISRICDNLVGRSLTRLLSRVVAPHSTAPQCDGSVEQGHRAPIIPQRAVLCCAPTVFGPVVVGRTYVDDDSSNESARCRSERSANRVLRAGTGRRRSPAGGLMPGGAGNVPGPRAPPPNSRNLT